MIVGTNSGAATDIYGHFIIKNIPPGKYKIRASFLAYHNYEDSLVIKSQDEVITLNIELKSYVVDLDSVSTPQLEAYHKKLEDENKIRPVMRVEIDSLTYSNYNLTAYLTMINTANDSFFIFKNYPCSTVIEPIISDSVGKILRRNASMPDCLGMKTCPDSNDLILLKPGERIHYPPTKLIFNNFRHYLTGKYLIKIKYEFKKPEKINLFWKRNPKVLVKGLRGSYISSNSITFINK